MKTKNKNGLSTKKFSLDELDKALRTAEDYLQRATIPFMILGQTLRSVIDNEQVDGDKIELGVRKRYLTKDTLGMLEMVTKFKYKGTKDKMEKIRFMVDEVPVEVKVIHRKFKVVENPDKVWYKVTEYCTPNPVSEYFKIKQFLR